MIQQGNQPIMDLMVGDMGIQTVLAGTEPVFQRQGAYVYIQLETEKGE
ncbi:hypothetical protein QUW63_02590 [Pseudoflavonifractor phocaeensis]|nr:hypothetical protein [Pseudoflavonifractor phocaeensis]MDM8237990.1 hypothetical protein [Pseudoflavonifractor phocaeensis]